MIMKDNLIKIPLHSIKLPKTGKNDDFVDKFNTASDLFEKVWVLCICFPF